MDNSQLAISLQKDKDSAFEWQKRRHPDWDDNYTLYRDRVITNRLTQRQSVNVPLMKTAIKTILANTDDEPDIEFVNLDNNKDKEILYNESWRTCAEKNKLVIKDIIDKKQVYLYGRSFKSLNILNGRVAIEVEDPYDMLVDRFTDPSDIDTAMCIIHQHIFRTLSQLEKNPDYDTGEIQKIRNYFDTDEGVKKSSENAESMQAKNERMRSMGQNDVDNPILSETWVEINKNFKKIWNIEDPTISPVSLRIILYCLLALRSLLIL